MSNGDLDNDDPETFESRLRESCFKLRSLAHLIGRQEEGMATELDEDEVWYGLELIIKDIHGEIMSVARGLGEQSIRSAKKKNRKP